MASKNEINEENQSKLELSQTQVNTIVSATGLPEAETRKIFG